ncbi:CGNR zinc finger domain-containing protein [Paractinoplanes deccanensis]|uniref:CGNR zinc finger domain-containing protein n=1 Tax=Paractinoplanes deccanensis TaxID=113561 RepID=UPI001EF3812B|nr:CGNR zinc finger domain-containing protein [Actinoplanes deccanensis]
MRLALSLVLDPPPSSAALATRCAGAGIALERPARPADLAETAAYLHRWLSVVDATGAERAARLNDLLRETAAYPRLTDHAGDGWHIHYREPDQSLASLLRTLISVGTALHLSGRGMHRLGRCAAAGCERPFADFSRTGRQRYCSHACGNRDAVRRHRSKVRDR